MDILQSNYSLRNFPVFETCYTLTSETARLRTKNQDRFLICRQDHHCMVEKKPKEPVMYTHYMTLYPKTSFDLLYGIPIPVDVVESIKITFHTKNSSIPVSFTRKEINNNMIFLPTSPYRRKNKSCSFEYLFCPFECGFPIAFCNKVDIELCSRYISLWNFRVVGAILSDEHRQKLLQTKNMNVIIETEPNSSLRSKLIYSHFKKPSSYRVIKMAFNYLEPFMCYRLQEIQNKMIKKGVCQ